MPKFLIERTMPGVGSLSAEQLKVISQSSCGVLKTLGQDVFWEHSYVTDDKIYCVYTAPNEETIREHARLGGFPAESVKEVRTMISPATAK